MRARGTGAPPRPVLGAEVCVSVDLGILAGLGRGSAAGDPLMATGGGAVAGQGAGATALGADGGQLAAAQQAQSLAETKRQAIALTAWQLCELAVLDATRPGALGPGLVAALVAVFLGQPTLGINALDQAPLDAATAGG